MTDEQGRSKPSSPCPSVVVDIPEPLMPDSPSPEVKSTVKIIRGEMKPRKNIYPSLATVKQRPHHFQNKTIPEWQNDEPLDPTLEAELEEEAARYEEERYGGRGPPCLS